jgi:hypothetical protein
MRSPHRDLGDRKKKKHILPTGQVGLFLLVTFSMSMISILHFKRISNIGSSGVSYSNYIPTTVTRNRLPIMDQQPTSFVAVIVHCREDSNMTAWYSQIPTDWNVTIYETCNQQASPRHNNTIQFKNAGSEECTAYLDYIIQNRDHLADITVFLQTDTFRKNGNKIKLHHTVNITGHSPFTHFDQLVNATNEAMVLPGQAKFLHYGWPFWDFGSNMSKADGLQNYVEEFLPEMWDIFAEAEDEEGKYINMNHGFDDKISTRPGAIFAVTRDRILANPSAIYEKLKDKILTSQVNTQHARKRCCSLENTWHVLFHEPAVLPKQSTVDQYYEGYKRWKY